MIYVNRLLILINTFQSIFTWMKPFDTVDTTVKHTPVINTHTHTPFATFGYTVDTSVCVDHVGDS